MARTDSAPGDGCRRISELRLVERVAEHFQGLHGEPFRLLDVAPCPVAASALPRGIAQRCFGDASLVYDVARRLGGAGALSVGDALNGSPPGFASLPGESLARFVGTHGRGVIVFDDLQAFPDTAMYILANISESRRVRAEGAASRDVPTGHLVILAFARLALPSPRGLMQRAGRLQPWPPGDAVPASFRDAVEQIARAAYPEHFRDWVTSRFDGVEGGFAWARYGELLARGALDTPIFDAPTDAPQSAVPPPPGVRDQVPDVGAIPALMLAAEPFDVFISYSWTRTADDAAWLRDYLRARGIRVYFDKDELDVSGEADEQVKRVLIQQLTATVQAARAWVVFAAAYRPFHMPPGMSREEALRRGLAMETPDGVLVEWSWQALEMAHMGRRLVIGEHLAYVVAGDGSFDSAFGSHPLTCREHIAVQVEDYLVEQGLIESFDPRWA